ncbi:MAG: hypothetical protein WCS70_05255 [Verrucomicrobiota bacterium]
MVGRYGFERIGFFTLTTPDSPPWDEYQRRLHSLTTHVFKELFEVWILVFEYHKDGRLHCHAVVACKVDIRTGFDFKLYLESRQPDRSLPEKRTLIRQAAANTANLRALWKVLRERLPGFGFGRHELIPIRKSADAIAWYVGGYIRKSLAGRGVEHKGRRFVRYSRGWRCASVHFAWNTEGAWLWRKKLAAFAQALGVKALEDMKFACGRHWAHHLKDKITAINDLTEYPTLAHARKDGWADAGTYGDHLHEIEVAGESALVESQRLPVDTVLLTAQELARSVIQANPVSHGNWKKWREFGKSREDG